MKKTNLLSLPVAISLLLGAQAVAFAQSSTDTTTQTPMDNQQSPPVHVRGDAIKAGMGERIADLPAGHWATHATQVAVANNVLDLQNGAFNGNQPLTGSELHHALDSLATTAETIAAKGALPDLRAAVNTVPQDDVAMTRLQVSQALARFLNAASAHNLLALGASNSNATRFNDLGASVTPAVRAVVDRYKVLNGFPDMTFRPQQKLTRYQMAAVASHILDEMREAPIAMQPVAPTIAVAPQAPPQIIFVPQAPIAAVPTPVPPYVRPSFRENAPITLSWQALNATNLTAGSAPFNVIPVSGMFTGYFGPVMLQDVANFRYNLYQSNLLDDQLRLGYANWKLGPAQFIPYVGADVGIGASQPSGNTQYDSYVGASYGGIVSYMPTDRVELWGNLGQTALLGAGRFNQNFQATNYPTALGSFLSDYGVGADFYIQPSIMLTVGLNTFQQPTNITTASNLSDGGVINTYGGNIGVGFKF